MGGNLTSKSIEDSIFQYMLIVEDSTNIKIGCMFVIGILILFWHGQKDEFQSWGKIQLNMNMH